jgi:hypothetical protein
MVVSCVLSKNLLFLKKKKKKTFPLCARAGRLARGQGRKSFLVLFFKKEPLPQLRAAIAFASAR